MADVNGVSMVALNGNDPGTLPGTDVELGGQEGAPVFASGVLAGFRNTPVPFVLRCKFVNKSTTDIEKIRKFKGQCDFRMRDTGVTYTSTDSQMTSPPKITDDGVECVIMGTAAVKTKG